MITTRECNKCDYKTMMMADDGISGIDCVKGNCEGKLEIIASELPEKEFNNLRQKLNA